jgi:hypothetical protein
MKRWLLLALLFVMAALRADAATTLLPNGMQCFQTAVGPVSSGSVAMYVPGTTTFKTTWLDPFQNAQNNAPIQLDQNGCAVIYGVGSYRQQLWTGPVVNGMASGNMVFDLLTADTSAGNSWFWAGTAGGTVNGIVLNDVGFTPTAGQNIQFQPSGPNGGPVTITPYQNGPVIPVVVDTNTGPVSLVGGELAANNVANVVYDAIANTFHLQNPLPTAGAVGVPLGGEISCAGFSAPSGFQFESGQLLDRGIFTALLNQLTQHLTGTYVSGNSTVTFTGGDLQQLAIGMAVEPVANMAKTTIQSINLVASQVTMVATASASGTADTVFFAYPNGDGSTTFNLPDRRGQLLYGRNNMGGSAQTGINSLTATYTTNSPNALGQSLHGPNALAGGGTQVTAGQLPTLNVSASEVAPGHTHLAPPSTTGYAVSGAGGLFYAAPTSTTIGTTSATTGTGTASSITGSTSNTSNTGFSLVSHGQTTNWCMRVQ